MKKKDISQQFEDMESLFDEEMLKEEEIQEKKSSAKSLREEGIREKVILKKKKSPNKLNKKKKMKVKLPDKEEVQEKIILKEEEVQERVIWKEEEVQAGRMGLASSKKELSQNVQVVLGSLLGVFFTVTVLVLFFVVLSKRSIYDLLSENTMILVLLGLFIGGGWEFFQNNAWTSSMGKIARKGLIIGLIWGGIVNILVPMTQQDEFLVPFIIGLFILVLPSGFMGWLLGYVFAFFLKIVFLWRDSF